MKKILMLSLALLTVAGVVAKDNQKIRKSVKRKKELGSNGAFADTDFKRREKPEHTKKAAKYDLNMKTQLNKLRKEALKRKRELEIELNSLRHFNL